MNSARSSNDIVLNSVCSNIVYYKDRFKVFENMLVKYNLELEEVRDDLPLFFSVLTYRIMEEFFNNINIGLNKLEVLFNKTTWSFLDQNGQNAREASIGWLRVCQMYTYIVTLIEESDHVTSNLMFFKSISQGDRKTFSLKIDLLLLKGDKISLLTITPSISSNKVMNGINNIDTLLALDYLYEAGISVHEVIELSYSHKGLHKNCFITRKFYPDKKIKTLVGIAVNNMKSDRPNLFYCIACPYRKKCSMDDVIYGKKK
jgi:hypothetical protein